MTKNWTSSSFSKGESDIFNSLKLLDSHILLLQSSRTHSPFDPPLFRSNKKAPMQVNSLYQFLFLYQFLRQLMKVLKELTSKEVFLCLSLHQYLYSFDFLWFEVFLNLESWESSEARFSSLVFFLLLMPILQFPGSSWKVSKQRKPKGEMQR